MRRSTFVASLSLAAVACAGAGCGSGSNSPGEGAASGDGGSSGSTSSSGSGSSGSGSGASSGTGSGATSGSSGGTSGGGTILDASAPTGRCTLAIPARGQAADTSNPTTVVGTGTAASCDFGHLQSAVTKGGVVTFNCGSAPATIKVTGTLNVPTTKNTVIDGGHLVTLDGGGSTQILSFNSANWQNNENSLTVQYITLTNAKMTGTMAIPAAPQPACSQGWDDGQGGAIYMRDGNLNVIDSIFTNNQAAPLGPDTGGGAIYVQGSKHGTVIVGSVFTGNSAANGGAVGGLFNELDVYDSTFMGNKAVGHDANNDDMSMCTVMNNGQYEVGSGGNGGALYSDGNSVNVVLCGDDIEGNAAGMNAFGGGLFFTSNNWQTSAGGTLTIADTTMSGNTGGHWTNVQTGTVKNVGTAVGTNNKSTTITNSMVQM
ncbi:MAG TPA: hypothetical protein VK762_27385 [Polyangiaceae bacterium]|jgi:hypothetical protein|nr:hypothetical protein [Polyangiaceae bacterium]